VLEVPWLRWNPEIAYGAAERIRADDMMVSLRRGGLKRAHTPGWPGANVIVLMLALASGGGCAHNTLDATGDGRLFLLLDLGPSRASGSVFQIDLEIEGMDPVREVVFDQRRSAPAGGLDVAGSINWLDLQGRPLDLMGEVLPGGAEVRMAIRTNDFDTNEISFNLDGNTTVRLFVANPEIPGGQHIEMELTLQQIF
jgi:hypothetical protein